MSMKMTKTTLLLRDFLTRGGDSHENSFRVKYYAVIPESIKSNLNAMDYHKRLLNGSNHGLIL